MMTITTNQENPRKPEFPIADLFINRWSPRAMSGEEITPEEIMSLFEAAKWAPSSYNNQPWIFLYALKDSPEWDLFFNLMGDFNKMWAEKAGALIVVVSKKTFDHNGEPSRTHSFDAGSATENLHLQGSMLGYVVHGMEGFDYDKAKKELDIPDDYNVECMIAVGKPGEKEDLSEQMQEREFPSPRKSVDDIAFEGKFKGK